jgi:ABC-type bacteriocin/lantibiotic exporter with double-glycine peptidase domain
LTQTAKMQIKRSILITICLLIYLCILEFGNALHQRISGIVFVGEEGVVWQKNSHDCGAAALQMVLSHFNIASDYNDLMLRLKVNSGGTNMLHLKRAAEARGLLCSGWRLTKLDLPNIPLPAILFVRWNHFVVLDSYSPAGTVLIRDPARGRLQITTQKLESMWGGETLLFYQSGNGSAGGGRWFGRSRSSERSQS